MAKKLFSPQCVKNNSKQKEAKLPIMIFLTTPVGSVSCERFFSALCCLKLRTGSSVTEECLSGLAMMLFHRGTNYMPTPKDFYERKLNLRL